ncbi:MAG: type I secretion system permease/ATPase [Pseudomonadota bacterium]
MGKLSLKWIAIFSIATNLLMIVPPLHMLQVYDRVLSSNSMETLIYITAIAIAAMVLYGASEAVRGVLAQRASARYTVMLSDPLFARLSKRSDNASEAAQLLRDFNMVRQFIASRVLIGLFDLPFAPLFILLMFMLHWTIGMLTLIGLGILIGVAFLNKILTAENGDASRAADSQALSFAQAVFSRAEDIRAMGLLPSVMDRWGDRMGDSLRTGDAAAGQSAMFFGISKAVRVMLQISIMAWGAYLVIQGDISGGVIFAASMLSSKALQPFEQVIGGWERITAARAAQANLDKFLAGYENDEEPMRLPDPVGHIEVNGLTFNPSEEPGSKPILDKVGFKLDAGKVLAIIGPSGAGKSTIAKCLVGALNYQDGQVRLDGAERSQYPESQWGETVGYVSQEITLFPGTLAENIARLSLAPDERRVVEASRAAGIHDMIVALPDGYGTEIGPGKVMLSGGQKQRVALARALYSNPRVLVLDEPNAHLDAQGEVSLIEAMKRARDAGRTIVIVTQRRSVLQVADYVMTIKDGRIASYELANFNTPPHAVRQQAAGQSAVAKQAPPRQVVVAPSLQTKGQGVQRVTVPASTNPGEGA